MAEKQSKQIKVQVEPVLDKTRVDSCVDCGAEAMGGDVYTCVRCGIPLCMSCHYIGGGFCGACYTETSVNYSEEEEYNGTDEEEGYGLEGM